MARIDLNGCEIHYDLMGSGPPVVLTPGGRLGGDAIRKTAEQLAENHRVVLWDRRNTGASHVWFGSEPEQLVWADDLAALCVTWTSPGPTWPAPRRGPGCLPDGLAPSGGGRRAGLVVGVRWALCQPESRLPIPRAVHQRSDQGGDGRGGAPPFFQERIEANPANRNRLMTTEAEQFVAALRRWNESFFHRPDTPVIAATTGELRTIRCPTLVFEGNDDLHPPEAAVALHELIEGSELSPLPWSTVEWMDHFMGRAPGSVMALYPRLVSTVLDFLARVEHDRTAASPHPIGKVAR